MQANTSLVLSSMSESFYSILSLYGSTPIVVASSHPPTYAGLYHIIKNE
uniref:Uncharacterized protein n=1 Tax=Arundo donax TaxID=35708 RepID=A0A0A8ZPS6_ARUDO